MRRLKMIIRTYSSALLLMVTLHSCQEKFQYTPFPSSAIFNSIYISIEDQSGNSLLSTPSFIDQITIFSEESREYVSKKHIRVDGESRLLIDAPCPNLSKLKHVSENEFYTALKLFLDGKSYSFGCIFLLSETKKTPPKSELAMYGSHSLRIAEVIFNGKSLQPEHIRLVFEDGVLRLKE